MATSSVGGQRRGRRGNAAVVGLTIGALLGFGALSVDVGLQRVADAQVQAAIEAGVLGGSGYLDRTIPSMFLAKQRAALIANENHVVGPWSVSADDVQVGIYDVTTRTFTEIDPATLVVGDPVVMQVNAVRIDTTHTSIRSILAGAVFGRDTLETTNTAMAMREPDKGAARSVPCYLPLAIPDCKYLDWLDGTLPSENPDPIKFVMSSAVVDNVGWGNPFTTNYGSQDIIDAFANEGCQDDDLEIGESMHVKNGQNTTVYKFLADVLEGQHADVQPTTWDHDIASRPARDGVHANCEPGYQWDGSGCISGNPNHGSELDAAEWAAEPVLQGPVALVTPPVCDNTQFVGSMPVSGFAWAMIYDVADGANDKNLFVQLDFIHEHDFGGDIDDDAPGNITGLDKPTLVY